MSLMMATRKPFETSRANLVRLLFESNHKWLDENSREEDTHSRELQGGCQHKKKQVKEERKTSALSRRPTDWSKPT